MSRSISCKLAGALLAGLASNAGANSVDRWFFAVESMPEIQGSLIVKTGFGSNYRYSVASPEATISLSMPSGRPMIKYKSTKVSCANSANTKVETEEDRAVFSGTMRCFSQMTRPAGHTEHAIEGWFTLKD